MSRRTSSCLLTLLVLLWSGPVSGQESGEHEKPRLKRECLQKVEHLKAVDSLIPALVLIDSLLEQYPNFVGGLILKSQLLLYTGDTSRAEFSLNRALEAAPRSNAARIMLAHLDVRRGRYESARVNLELLLNVNKLNHRALRVQGELYAATGRPDSAAACYQNAVEVLLKKKRMMP